MADFKDRLNELFKILKLSQVKASEKTGVGRSSLSEYLAGKKEPTISIVNKIAIATDVSLNWLLRGIGPIFMAEIINKEKKALRPEDIPKEQIKEWLDNFWEQADSDEKAWLKIELKKKFPEYADWLKREKSE